MKQVGLSQIPSWLCYLESCQSTNTWALENINSLDSGTVIFTHRQTAGRGQLGRNWYSPSGTITSSFVFKQIPDRQLTGLSLIFGLAVIYAVEDLIPNLRGRLGLKWPNDVFLQGRKLAGILCEMVTNPQPDGRVIVVGIGLNHGTDFTDLSSPNLDFQGVSQPISLREVTATLPSELKFLEQIRQYLLETVGCLEFYVRKQTLALTAFATAIAERDTLRDREITLELLYTQVTGIAAGINDRGELLLRFPDGSIQSFAAGRVSSINPPLTDLK
jgi:BirA family biotin operon repressor/biotin-[acetyl-CoA-carboxylase] ligase